MCIVDTFDNLSGNECAHVRACSVSHCKKKKTGREGALQTRDGLHESWTYYVYCVYLSITSCDTALTDKFGSHV